MNFFPSSILHNALLFFWEEEQPTKSYLHCEKISECEQSVKSNKKYSGGFQFVVLR